MRGMGSRGRAELPRTRTIRGQIPIVGGPGTVSGGGGCCWPEQLQRRNAVDRGDWRIAKRTDHTGNGTATPSCREPQRWRDNGSVRTVAEAHRATARTASHRRQVRRAPEFREPWSGWRWASGQPGDRRERRKPGPGWRWRRLVTQSQAEAEAVEERGACGGGRGHGGATGGASIGIAAYRFDRHLDARRP